MNEPTAHGHVTGAPTYAADAVAKPTAPEVPAIIAEPVGPAAEPLLPALPVALADKLTAHVRASGGKVTATQRSLALALGTNPAAVNRALAALAQAGAVRLRTGANGTSIRLMQVA